MFLSNQGLEELAQLLTEEQHDRFLATMRLSQKAGELGAGVVMRMEVNLTISADSPKLLEQIEEEARQLGATVSSPAIGPLGGSVRMTITFPDHVPT